MADGQRPDLNKEATAAPTLSGRGPKRKLPTMNPSERAKYYRQRVRAYTATLETDEGQLTRQVESLAQLRTLQTKLLELQPTARLRRSVLSSIGDFLDTRLCVQSDYLLLSDAHVTIEGVDVHGDDTGVVVHLQTCVQGVFIHETVEKQLYPFVPGNVRLLRTLLHARLVCASSFHFFFDADGTVADETHTIDLPAALLHALGCSATEVIQLLPAFTRHDRDDAATTTFSPNGGRLRPLLGGSSTRAVLGFDTVS